MRKISIILTAAVIFSTCAYATIIHVPGNYPSIQAGINAANPGDTVQVAPGIYYENVQMSEGISLFGSGAENTTIDGGGLADVVSALQVNNLVIEGFTVQNSQQGGSSPGNIGVFINPSSSTGVKIVRNCIICNNGNGIDIWNDFGGTAYIENNLIHDNIYDGFDPYLGTVYLTNNTIVSNGRDGYSDWAGGGYVQIQNNIFANNGRYGIFKHQNTPVYISYNDVWHNAEGAYYQGYSGPHQPFTPNPGTGEIAADPLFAGGATNNYHLSWANFPIPDFTKSPCIDTGNPNSPLDPDLTRADMGAYYFNQSTHDVSVTLTPIAPPIQIPYSTGGAFDYNVEITNHENITVECDVWIKFYSPERVLVGPIHLTLNGGMSIIRDRTQNVPGSVLPAGNYTYEINVGSYPFPIWDSDSFIFEIVPGSDQGASANCLTVHPNPFNPETTISFTLPEAAEISLVIYDIQGREVVRLFDGWYPAGVHESNFDASNSPSGVYFACLQTNGFSQTKKLLLVK